MSVEPHSHRIEKIRRQISNLKALLARYPHWTHGRETLGKLEQELRQVEAEA